MSIYFPNPAALHRVKCVNTRQIKLEFFNP